MPLKGSKAGSAERLRKKLKSKGGFKIRRVPDEGIRVRFLEEVDDWFEYEEVFDRDAQIGYALMEGESVDDFDNADVSTRVLANAWDVVEERAILLKMPPSAVQDILLTEQRDGTVLNRDYEITKEGKGMQTRYSVYAHDKAKLRLPPDLELSDHEEELMKERRQQLGEAAPAEKPAPKATAAKRMPTKKAPPARRIVRR